MNKKQEYICRECSHPAVVEYTPPSELGETRSSIYYCAPCSLLRQHQRRVRDWERAKERAGRDWLGRKRIEPKPEFWDYIPAYRWKRLGGPAQPWEVMRAAARMLEDSGWIGEPEWRRRLPRICPWTLEISSPDPLTLQEALQWASQGSPDGVLQEAQRLLLEWVGLEPDPRELESRLWKWGQDPLRSEVETISALRAAADMAELQAQGVAA